MQKIGASTASANALGEFTEGNPGAGVEATLLKAAWLNAIQRELVNLIEGAGLTLTAADDSQLLKAVQAIQSAANTWAKLGGKPTTIGGFGIADAYTKTETVNAINAAVAALVASSPAALDTLKELADALGNDPNFATTMTNALAGKASKANTLGGYGITDAFTKPETASAIQQAIASLVASSPAALDTLKELADALGNDPNFATTITNQLAGKYDKAGGVISGQVVISSSAQTETSAGLIVQNPGGVGSFANLTLGTSTGSVIVSYKGGANEVYLRNHVTDYITLDVGAVRSNGQLCHTASTFLKPGAGQWISLANGATLPAGGTWAYFLLNYNGAGALVNSSVGLVAGGTALGGGYSTGFAWRFQ